MVYPFKKYNYNILIDGFKQAEFAEVSAADTEVQPIEYREGDAKKMSPGKLSGLVKYGNVTLKWGISDRKEFMDWIKKCQGGETECKKVVIRLMDDKNIESKAEWVLENAWPTKYTLMSSLAANPPVRACITGCSKACTAPDFNENDNEVSFESIELYHEGLTRTK